MDVSVKCSRCEEDMIREELEDQEFLELGRSISGSPLCFECFTVVANARGKRHGKNRRRMK